MIRAIAICALVGCSSSTKTTLPSNQADAGPSAERAFLDSLVPDYSSPADRHASAARKRAGDLYARDCRSGVLDACWWAKELLGGSDFDATIAANCAAGHAMSCRSTKLQSGLTSQQLHEGCAAGLDIECEQLAQIAETIAESRFAWERSCAITRATCRPAAEAFLKSEPRDPMKARDLLELGCSFDRAGECVPLAAAYLRKELVEPMPNRGRMLFDYACGTTPQRGGPACEQGENTPLIRALIDI